MLRHLLITSLLLLSCSLLQAAPIVTELQDSLEHPWPLAFLPDDKGILITERPGRLRLWQQDSRLSEPIAGVPPVYARGRGIT